MNVFQRFGVGVKAWYLAWFVEGGADAVARGLPAPGSPLPHRIALEPPKPAVPPPSTKPITPTKPAPPPRPARSDALALLEALQREARLIDFLREEIAGYDDAQVGAAVREVHRGAAAVLERLFALRPVADTAEGEPVSLTTGPLAGPSAAGRVRLVGNVREGATAGTLAHHGWIATKADLPAWTGPAGAERVVAPAEVEVS